MAQRQVTRVRKDPGADVFALCSKVDFLVSGGKMWKQSRTLNRRCTHTTSRIPWAEPSMYTWHEHRPVRSICGPTGKVRHTSIWKIFRTAPVGGAPAHAPPPSGMDRSLDDLVTPSFPIRTLSRCSGGSPLANQRHTRWFGASPIQWTLPPIFAGLTDPTPITPPADSDTARAHSDRQRD